MERYNPKKKAEEPRYGLPPAWCGGICKNAMTDDCCDGCAITRNMSAFKLKKGVELSDLPPFPLDDFIEAMTPNERKVIMAVYMAKAVDFIQGRKELPNVYQRRGTSLSEADHGRDRFQENEVDGAHQERDGTSQNRAELLRETVRSQTVAGDDEGNAA
jgi:hypothetical protein